MSLVCRLVALLFTICWLPYACAALIAQFIDPALINAHMMAVVSVVAKSSTVLNPIIYWHADTAYRRAARAVIGLGVDKCTAAVSDWWYNESTSSARESMCRDCGRVRHVELSSDARELAVVLFGKRAMHQYRHRCHCVCHDVHCHRCYVVSAPGSFV